DLEAKKQPKSCRDSVPRRLLRSPLESLLPSYTKMDQPELEVSEIDELERVVGDAGAKARRLELSLLERITNRFSDERRIGSGGFGEVYLGVLPSGLRIAVKKLYPIAGLDEIAFANEISIIMKVAHENIVRLIGYCDHTNHEHIEHNGKLIFAKYRQILICTEYMPNGSLTSHINDEFHGGLDWNQRYQILKGICQGMRHLHDEAHVLHGDLKPDNILLGANLVPKIHDFGLSRLLDKGETSGYTKNVYGTRGYIPPEMLQGHWSTKSDIYSLGVIIMELLTGNRWLEPSVLQVLKQLRKKLVKEGAFSSWENKYRQVRTCLEIGYTCMEIDSDKRPTALQIIQLLDETESTNYSAASLWQSGDEESDSSDTEALEIETTTEFFPSDEEPASADTTGETSTQEPDKPDLVSKLPALVDLSDLKVLEKITDNFSHKRIVGKDGTFKGSHKAFVYKGDIPCQEMIAVKRLIGVEIPVEKFKREAEQFISLDHKNIVKVASYCHDQSRGHRLVQFKGEPLPHLFNGAEQLLCYEYMHNGSLRDYLVGMIPVKNLVKLIGRCTTN
uniref:Protein kinase domain-containing protein n=1 Tax=Aegilops tauschii subsp. strangulata TaxID=200361 RepID=A0A452XSK1_AEGTS